MLSAASLVSPFAQVLFLPDYVDFRPRSYFFASSPLSKVAKRGSSPLANSKQARSQQNRRRFFKTLREKKDAKRGPVLPDVAREAVRN